MIILLQAAGQIIDHVADSFFAFYVFVGYLYTQQLFKPHDHFHNIKGIRSQVVDEFGFNLDHFRFNSQLVYYYFLYFFKNI